MFLQGLVFVLLKSSITLLSPESIGPMQSVAPFFSVAVQGLVQRGETRMELVLGQGEMENLRHLGFGVTPGTCIGHRQSRRDAAGREEQIAGLLGSESGIKVEGEPVVTPDDGSHVGLHVVIPGPVSLGRSTGEDRVSRRSRGPGENHTSGPMARRHEVISKAVVVLQKFGDLLRRVGRLDETGPRRSSFHLNNDRTFGERRYRFLLSISRDDDRLSAYQSLGTVGADQEDCAVSLLDERVSRGTGYSELLD